MSTKLEQLVNDSIRGCLMAGAAGDALGYTVEFISRNAIIAKYGKQGIHKFELNSNGKALVSDDTQMTLFTTNGILMGVTRGYMRGVGGIPEDYVMYAYTDWYFTQNPKEIEKDYYPYTWLFRLPEMYHHRAPGITCLNACKSFIQCKEVVNNSKGCGGVMRVAPLSLLIAGYAMRGDFTYDTIRLAEANAKIAQETHKHPLGFLPAALLGELIYRVTLLSVEDAKSQIWDIATNSLSVLDSIYIGLYEAEKEYLKQLTQKAIALAKSDLSDIEAIMKLGEGWVAEEAWAVSLYCALRHIDSVEEAIIASVNHDGDSDSTGSITGNIMGAIYGYEHIKQLNLFCPKGCQLEQTLELSEVILALADDLTTSCIISEWDYGDTPEKIQWYERYCEHRPAGISSYELKNKR